MKDLFDMPLKFSSLITRNEGFQKALLEICGKKYERPKVAVIRKYMYKYEVLGEEEVVDFIFDNGEVRRDYPYNIENLPSDKEIAKNKKLYEFWKSTMKQLKED